MFIHTVLFEIEPSQVRHYHRDNRMWAGHARKSRGFIRYRTFKRHGFKNQYASVYQWEEKKAHDTFMKKFHDWLVAESRARVKVLGYYNFKVVDER